MVSGRGGINERTCNKTDLLLFFSLNVIGLIFFVSSFISGLSRTSKLYEYVSPQMSKEYSTLKYGIGSVIILEYLAECTL